MKTSIFLLSCSIKRGFFFSNIFVANIKYSEFSVLLLMSLGGKVYTLGTCSSQNILNILKGLNRIIFSIEQTAFKINW